MTWKVLIEQAEHQDWLMLLRCIRTLWPQRPLDKRIGADTIILKLAARHTEKDTIPFPHHRMDLVIVRRKIERRQSDHPGQIAADGLGNGHAQVQQ